MATDSVSLRNPYSENERAVRLATLSPAKRALFELELKKISERTHGEAPIRRRADQECSPLSFAQQRLWFLNQLEPEDLSYNGPKAIRLTGSLDRNALANALGQIVARHEVLRTTFVPVNGSPEQRIADTRNIELPIIDLSTRPENLRAVEAQRLLVETIQRPFDLSRDLMMRALLVRLDEQEHILLLVTHHIASDGWSERILWQELGALYKVFASGQPSPLPELPIQYADYAVWQRQWLQGEVLETQLSYWKKQLEGVAVLELPVDRPRPAVQSHRGAKEYFALSEELTRALKALSRQQGATLYMTLLAAFQTLLYRYTAQPDIAVGSPIAGRNRIEIESLIGFFVNTLVLRNDLSGNPTFKELLTRTSEVCLCAYAHQDLPFEKLVEELQPERTLSQSPLFQVMFTLQNVPTEVLQLPGLTTNFIELDNGATEFDLQLALREEAHGLTGTVYFNTDLFDSIRITRMLGHLETLLQGIVINPNQHISDLPILTEAEKHRLLVEWNDTRKDYPKGDCVHELFEAQVQRSPDAVAVIFEDQRLTYDQLNQRANRLAHDLIKLGVGPEVLVGLCMEPSLEMVVALLGILKAGGAYVPLDPAYPKQRLAFMLEDSRVSVLLTQQQLLTLLPPDHGAQLVWVDTNWTQVAEQDDINPDHRTAPENLAYVIYTSGSTGNPKGVPILHRGVVNFLSAMRCESGLDAKDTLLAVTNLSFDIAGLELYLPLTVGACVVLANREIAADGDLLLEELSDSRATVMQATPATWRLLIEAGWQGDEHLKILCGGETLSRELAAQLLTRGSLLSNLYGPTETTIWSSVYQVLATNGPVPIGRPIANSQFYVLDRYLNALPVGIPGELHIGGDGLARGYLSRPELTAENFIANPFATEDGARLYKTGDLVRYLPDGNIEFLGRSDHQVKVRGFRIELGEIEAHLISHTSVQDAVVLARDEDTTGDKRLIAYVVSDSERPVPIDDLRDFLREKLPDYMVPSGFQYLDALPLTPNGKVDRQALPAPAQTRPELKDAFVAPHTPAEKLMVDIWAEVLDLELIGMHDNFFTLGGHSMLATQVISRIRKAFRVELPLRAIFQKPTIEELAKLVTDMEIEQTEFDDLARMLEEIELLSDERAQELIVRGDAENNQIKSK